jgi:hypothetical protein
MPDEGHFNGVSTKIFHEEMFKQTSAWYELASEKEPVLYPSR